VLERLNKTMLLNETPNVPPAESGLPIKIWIDDNDTAKNHSKYYIKIFPKLPHTKQGDGVEMTIDPNPTFPKTQIDLRKFNMSNWELECVKQWVRDNWVNLRKIGEHNLRLQEFLDARHNQDPEAKIKHVPPKTKLQIRSMKDELAKASQNPAPVPQSNSLRISYDIGESSTMYQTNVIRKGKRVKLWKTEKEGYRIEYDERGRPVEVEIKPIEQLRREIGQVSAQEKRDGMMGELQRRRLISMAKKPIVQASGKIDPEDVCHMKTLRERLLEGMDLPPEPPGIEMAEPGHQAQKPSLTFSREPPVPYKPSLSKPSHPGTSEQGADEKRKKEKASIAEFFRKFLARANDAQIAVFKKFMELPTVETIKSILRIPFIPQMIEEEKRKQRELDKEKWNNITDRQFCEDMAKLYKTTFYQCLIDYDRHKRENDIQSIGPTQ